MVAFVALECLLRLGRCFWHWLGRAPFVSLFFFQAEPVNGHSALGKMWARYAWSWRSWPCWRLAWGLRRFTAFWVTMRSYRAAAMLANRSLDHHLLKPVDVDRLLRLIERSSGGLPTQGGWGR